MVNNSLLAGKRFPKIAFRALKKVKCMVYFSHNEDIFAKDKIKTLPNCNIKFIACIISPDISRRGSSSFLNIG